MKLFEEKKKRYRNLLLVLLPFLLIGGFFGYTLYSGAKDLFNGGDTDEIEQSPKYSLPEYGYQLRANCTDIQFEYFQELIEAINSEDDLAAAQAVAKCFVADFYTFSNKSGQYDIGGMSYVCSSRIANIYSQARDHVYHYLNYFIDAYGAENLLEVEEVHVLDAKKQEDDYILDGVAHPWWYVRAEWTYVDKDSDFITSDYETFQDIFIIKNVESGRYEIVQMYGME